MRYGGDTVRYTVRGVSEWVRVFVCVCVCGPGGTLKDQEPSTIIIIRQEFGTRMVANPRGAMTFGMLRAAMAAAANIPLSCLVWLSRHIRLCSRRRVMSLTYQGHTTNHFQRNEVHFQHSSLQRPDSNPPKKNPLSSQAGQRLVFLISVVGV